MLGVMVLGVDPVWTHEAFLDYMFVWEPWCWVLVHLVWFPFVSSLSCCVRWVVCVYLWMSAPWLSLSFSSVMPVSHVCAIVSLCQIVCLSLCLSVCFLYFLFYCGSHLSCVCYVQFCPAVFPKYFLCAPTPWAVNWLSLAGKHCVLIWVYLTKIIPSMWKSKKTTITMKHTFLNEVDL